MFFFSAELSFGGSKDRGLEEGEHQFVKTWLTSIE